MIELIGTARVNQILELEPYMATKSLVKHLSSHSIEPIGQDASGNLKWNLTEVCSLAESTKKTINKVINIHGPDASELMRALELNFECMGEDIEFIKRQHIGIYKQLERIEKVLKDFSS